MCSGKKKKKIKKFFFILLFAGSGGSKSRLGQISEKVQQTPCIHALPPCVVQRPPFFFLITHHPQMFKIGLQYYVTMSKGLTLLPPHDNKKHVTPTNLKSIYRKSRKKKITRSLLNTLIVDCQCPRGSSRPTFFFTHPKMIFQNKSARACDKIN